MQCWKDRLECLVDLLSDFGTCEHDLTADEYQQNNLGLDHSVDKTREELRLVRAERVMLSSKTFKSNWESNVARADDVLNLEVSELGVEAELLNDSSIFSASKLRVVLRLSTSDDHLARGEDQSSRLWFSNSHDDSSESLGVGQQMRSN